MEKLLVIAAFSFAIVLGFDDKDIFGQQGSELLKQLKESGVIDKFEEELLHMLKEEGPATIKVRVIMLFDCAYDN